MLNTINQCMYTISLKTSNVVFLVYRKHRVNSNLVQGNSPIYKLITMLNITYSTLRYVLRKQKYTWYCMHREVLSVACNTQNILQLQNMG